MSIEQIVTVALITTLLVSVAVRMVVNRSGGSATSGSSKREQVDMEAEKARNEFGLPAHPRGLDSDFVATKVLMDAVLLREKTGLTKARK